MQNLLVTRQKEFITARTKTRDVERRIRSLRREIVPLTTGLVIFIKKDRGRRLRALVRLRKSSAIKIQSLWRRAIIRSLYVQPERDYWIECFDIEQGPDAYYFNTYTQVTAWKEPLSFRFFGRLIQERLSRAAQQSERSGQSEWIQVEQNGTKYMFNVKTQEYA